MLAPFFHGFRSHVPSFSINHFQPSPCVDLLSDLPPQFPFSVEPDLVLLSQPLERDRFAAQFLTYSAFVPFPLRILGGCWFSLFLLGFRSAGLPCPGRVLRGLGFPSLSDWPFLTLFFLVLRSFSFC
jgi:hypothetical protein